MKLLTFVFLYFLFTNSVSSVRPFQKMALIKKSSSSNKLNQMKNENECFIKNKIKEAIKERLDKLPKVIIVPPQSNEENWESGEVKWEPADELPEKPKGNGTVQGYVIFPPTKPISPVDFAISTIF
jgi:hypothetical protein